MRISGDSSPGVRSTRTLPVRAGRSLLVAVFLASIVACNDDLPLAPEPTHASVDPAPSAATPDADGSIKTAPPGTGEAAMGPSEGTPDRRTAATRFRESMRPNLAEWRRSLNEIARVSPRGERAVAMRRIVLAALEAESDEEYHRILRQLPRRSGQIARSNGAPEDGSPEDADRSAFVGSFVMNGLYARAGATTYSLTRTAESSVSGPSAGLAEMSFSAECSMVWEEVEYVDECATQGEIDEGFAVLGAVEVEVTADQAEAQAMCWEIYGPDEFTCTPESASNATTGHEYAQGRVNGASPSFVLASNSSSEAARVVSVSLPLTEESNCGVADISTAFREAEATDPNCAVEATLAAVGVFTWVGSKFQAQQVWEKGGPRSAYIFMYGGLLTGGLATGVGVGTWLNCLFERRKELRDPSNPENREGGTAPPP